MKTFLKLTVAPLMIILVLLITSCQPTRTPTPPPTQPPVPQRTIAPTPTPADAQWKEVMAAARQEGKLVFYGEIHTPVRTAISDAMKNKYGIEVEVISGKSPEVAQKFLSE
ncbi:MAG: hypothetical protein U1D67_05340, partial [Dehalococcoidia bacterium]|nr:hypothetical protein [Dehalococcoidia bacterium]